MSNQVAMTFFDKSFIEDRLNECLAIFRFQLQLALDGFPLNSDLCSKFSESFQNFSRHLEPGSGYGFTLNERRAFFDRYFYLKGALKDLQNEQPAVRKVNDSAAQPVAPTQLSVCRVLGQVSKAATERQERPLSLGWFPITAQLLSNTRSVGGLA